MSCLRTAMLISTALMAVAPVSAQAGVIQSFVGAVVNSGGPGYGDIADTYNQDGLLTNYVSGVTDFNSYIAGNPLENYVFTGNEWFSNLGTTSADITYDLGGAFSIASLAYWNEDASGVGQLQISYSKDGINFTNIGIFDPTDNPIDVNYGPQVFSFGTVDARYVNLSLSGCPQSGDAFAACGVGEVAANVVSTVPLPASAPMFGLALLTLAGFAYGVKRRTVALADLTPVA